MNATGMREVIVGVAAMALSLQPARGQAPSAFSTIDVRSPAAPRPLIAGGATHLVYELYITNLSPRETVLDAVDVTDRTAAAGAMPLLHLEGAALDSALRRVGAPRDDREPPHVLPGGRTAVLFLWVTLDGGAPPAALSHRFATHLAGVAHIAQRFAIDWVRLYDEGRDGRGRHPVRLRVLHARGKPG
jgi:hypothetical protein